MKYIVSIPVETLECYEVEADNEEEAKKMVGNGEGEPVDSDCHYVDEDSNNWTVEKQEEE